jgi:hypothetical protein
MLKSTATWTLLTAPDWTRDTSSHRIATHGRNKRTNGGYGGTAERRLSVWLMCPSLLFRVSIQDQAFFCDSRRGRGHFSAKPRAMSHLLPLLLCCCLVTYDTGELVGWLLVALRPPSRFPPKPMIYPIIHTYIQAQAQTVISSVLSRRPEQKMAIGCVSKMKIHVYRSRVFIHDQF